VEAVELCYLDPAMPSVGMEAQSLLLLELAIVELVVT
jgi:hypothetical protein